ncbi:6-phosphogluconolactonase, cycloisomerase 2 family [Enhydrobacter aerosaccus]|uniref:6-phosphogluconolactonase, cycloisomerase 2 family n=1 Tax=Enhydrobacter aerosaccus TaxID=225324 RepID=A0A1T4LC26_9HYPH|nr:lactonase family protein [Enhydrobacter aerosaccus]SJZ52087.1 6-phosphogluconolactonase, cycloisomerase 2 family [Enhydrobacter aerosaccus]
METLYAYVGCYTTPQRNGQGNGINVYRVDRRSGAFSHVQCLEGLENPSFLAVDSAGRHLYSVHGDRSEATAFTIDVRTGRLHLLNRQPTGGFNPIHLAFDRTGRALVVSNYGSDSIAVLPILKNGALGPYPTLTAVTGALGPHRIEQKNIRPHHNPLDREGRHFFLPCKGGDSIISYRVNRKKGVLVEAARVAARPGAGPRHIAFHPRRPLAYVVNELDSTITTYRKDGAKLVPLQLVPSTPPDFTGYSTGAEIAVDRAGRNVYVSNRGHNSIGVFAVDVATGALAPKQWVPTHGTVPRFFTLDPDGRFLYVANQGSHTIFAYRIGVDGKLSLTSVKVKVGSPACIVFNKGGPS